MKIIWTSIKLFWFVIKVLMKTEDMKDDKKYKSFESFVIHKTVMALLLRAYVNNDGNEVDKLLKDQEKIDQISKKFTINYFNFFFKNERNGARV